MSGGVYDILIREHLGMDNRPVMAGAGGGGLVTAGNTRELGGCCL